MKVPLYPLLGDPQSVYLSPNGNLTNFCFQQAKNTFILYQRIKCSILDISAISQSDSLLNFISQHLKDP